MADLIRFRLFGPVRLMVNGRTIDLGPPKHLALLGALLLEPGRCLPAETLTERVWGAQLPQRPRQALYTYVARLRRSLDGVADLDRSPAGYALQVPPSCVDVHEFGALLRQARLTGDPAARARLLERALDLADGEPLGGAGGEWADGVRDHLRRQREEAAIALARLQVDGGDAAHAVGRLQQLYAADRLSEPLAAALMTALSASGRRAQALTLYERFRLRLADELGVDPGPQLRAVHLDLLSSAAPGRS